ELEWKQEEEYEKQLLEMTIKGNKAAQVELSERMMSKTSPQLRKYILEEKSFQNKEIVEKTEQ
ncbi:MAG TPA: hypothetical protein VK870_01475, partial [Ignavibacteriaceae bacterium]|nr:hypothetical protein [Ignavibacteriaceae bacterium]